MTNIAAILVAVCVIVSVVLAIMDRTILSSMYLLVLAIVIMLATGAKWPW